MAKWEGKAVAGIREAKAEQVWSCLEDFCNLKKWFPYIDTCRRLEGVPGQPGLIRYLASTRTLSSEKTSEVRWVKERLIMMDPIGKCFSYELVDNNVGFKSFWATIKVFEGGESGCVVEWWFEAEPIDGWRRDDLVSYIDNRLQFMARNIQLELRIQ